ncbi:Aspartyl protease inhibitor [Aphelenchoides fujianensis]|nr:Aspartyl protease inhibitor [Aphelenchoides fujianensis]
MTEFNDYAKKLAAVREEIKQLVKERQAEALERRRTGESAIAATTNQKTPEAPKKPSFCSAEATTQYIFDGCKVQNNAVFIGNTFARKLDATEIEELKQFDKEMSAYQKTVSASLESQLSELFGRGQISRGSGEVDRLAGRRARRAAEDARLLHPPLNERIIIECKPSFPPLCSQHQQ